MIKILVIGNGFDLAHGLKTSYGDFIKWYQALVTIYDNTYRGGMDIVTQQELENALEFRSKNAKEYNEIMEKRNNFWISHFLKIKKEIGEQWLDFESEVEQVTKRIYFGFQNDTSRRINYYVRNECSADVDVPRFSTVEETFEWLDNQLRILTRFLEIYLCKYANNRIDKSQRMTLFTEIKPNKLLNFNYTNTYKDVYNKAIPADYIHGKAKMEHSVDECDMVLGFDDHYLDDVNTVSELVPFEKYYQRIVHRNSNDYFKWIEQKDNYGMPEQKQVYFYGHSLSPADGDIIKMLIEAENTRTTIFYRKSHEQDRAKMIKNLAVILTPNGLIKRIGGSNPTIEFVPV